MLSVSKHKRDGRLLIWILLLISVCGPWFFDLLYIPSEYPCSVRLRENFCGTPVPGLYVLFAAFGALVSSFGDLVRRFLFSLFGLSLVLPFFSTLLVVKRENRRPYLAFHLIACSVALIASLVFGLLQHFNRFWLLWGVWLYVGLLASALILEVVVLVEKRRHSQGG